MSNESQNIKEELPLEPADPGVQEAQERVQTSDSIELGLRLLVGLLAIGGDEAARRLQVMQRKLDDDPSLWMAEEPSGEISIRRQAWRLSVGLIRRGHRRLHSELRRSLELLIGSERSSTLPTRWGVRRFPNPVRDTFEAKLVQWRKKLLVIIREGELEEQKGRALAKGAVTELINEIIAEIAENPEIQDIVQDVVGQQGVGMATSVVDNARSVTVTADDAAEGLIRWLLRRTPRQELPPSPVEGQPQTMYAPKVKIEGKILDDD